METISYFTRYFIEKDEFVENSGAPEPLVDDLLAAGAMPGIIYSYSEKEGWWSVLGTASPLQPSEGRHFYSPAALWWCRRALMEVRRGKSPSAAALSNRRRFVDTFVEKVGSEPFAGRAFPSAFANGSLDNAAARKVAEGEWGDWIGGGYGVCLRRFTAETCIRKEALGRRIKDHFEHDDRLSDDILFDLVEQLESLLLPFAPWERESCTPGKTVDRSLAALSLGREQPYLVR